MFQIHKLRDWASGQFVVICSCGLAFLTLHEIPESDGTLEYYMRFAQTSWQLRRAEIRLLYRRGCGRASRLSLGSCPAAAQSATIGARSLTIRPAPHPLKHFGFQHGFAEKFEQQEQIGAGSFGQVFVAVDRLTGDRCTSLLRWATLRMRTSGPG